MTTSDPKAFGTRVQTLRVAAGFTQKTFADAIGRDTSTVERFEQGRTPKPPPALLRAMAAALKMSVGELLGQGDAPPPSAWPSAVSPEDERLIRVLRGPLYGARPFFLKFAELPAFDQRWVLDTLEYCEARIDAANDWERRRRSRVERDAPDDAPSRNGSLDHAGA